MSDKIYTLPGGESFESHKREGERLEIRRSGEQEGKLLPRAGERSVIDHETKRVLTKSDTKREAFWVYSYKNKRILSWPGGSLELEAVDLSEGGGAGGGALKPLKLTMPGKVLDIKVKEGDIVEAGTGLIVVEAMKMENLLLAPARAKIAKIHVKAGDRLESGATLFSFEAP